jgi:RNA polymerase sigma-70 factor (ECF subfamily)
MPDKKSSSIRELFLRNKRGLLTYLTRRVGREDAPDLLQETFVRALRHDGFEAVVDPPAFLQQIAVNLTRDFARRRKTEANCLEFVGDLPEDAPSREVLPDEQFGLEQKTRLLREAMGALPPRCREVFAMFMFEDLPVEEIATRLGISRNVAHKHMRLALQRCRAALD